MNELMSAEQIALYLDQTSQRAKRKP